VRSCFRVGNVKVGFPRSVMASSWMPTSMCALADAAGTHKPAATKTIAAATPIRLGNDRLPSETRQHAAQAFLELYLRLPAEQLASAGDVGLPDLRIVDGQRLVDDLASRPGDAEDGLGQLVESELTGIAEVDRQVLAGFGQQDEPANEVVHVAEAARLAAVAEHSQWLALDGLSDKRRNRTPVARPHPWTVGIEDSCDRGIDALLCVVGHRHRLGVALGLVVDTARPDRVDVAPVRLRLGVHLRVAVDLTRGSEQKTGALELREPERVVRAVRAHLQRMQRH